MMDKKSTSFIAACIDKIQNDGVLSRAEARDAFTLILHNQTSLTDFYWGTLFGAIQTRGTNLQESMGLVDAVLEFDKNIAVYANNKIRVCTNKPVVSITGSGKETFKTINVSTISAIIAASCGVCMLKPGSSSTSATSGATDILLELGVRIPKDLYEAKRCAEEIDLCFVDFSSIAMKYAERYDGLFYHFHPLSYVVPPLTIPFELDAFVYGIANSNVKHGAEVLREIGYEKAAVVFSEIAGVGKIDELTPFGNSYIAYLNHGEITYQQRTGKTPTIDELSAFRQRNSHRANATVLLELLQGKGSQLLIELVFINVALLLSIAGLSRNLDEGMHLANESVHRGEALRKLEQCVQYSQKFSGECIELTKITR